ncbi:MAG TPA: hypothetical protein VFX97_16805 [Pyrinomonadaceae bacterium]|nr:hypothetical protein [Pyrinomonadaceae bacterium]
MKWDPKDRRYEDENGHPLTQSEVRKRIEEYIEHGQREVDRQANKLFIGALSLSAFFELLRHKITSWHSVAGLAAYGEPDNKQWSRINQKILSELDFLNRFEAEAQASFFAAETIASQVVTSLGNKIPAGLESLVEERVAQALLKAAPSEAAVVARSVVAETLADSVAEASVIAQSVEVAGAEPLIGATIPSRAGMYVDSTYGTFENSVRDRESDAGAVGVRRVSENDGNVCEDCEAWASDEYVPLSEIQDIGSGQCGSRDRCTFEFSYEGVEPLTIDRRLTG